MLGVPDLVLRASRALEVRVDDLAHCRRPLGHVVLERRAFVAAVAEAVAARAALKREIDRHEPRTREWSLLRSRADAIVAEVGTDDRDSARHAWTLLRPAVIRQADRTRPAT
jgi:hypothetical protein